MLRTAHFCATAIPAPHVCRYLHNNNVVHGDLRPEHILLLRPIEQLGAGGSTCIVKIVDHAESQFMSVPSLTPLYCAMD